MEVVTLIENLVYKGGLKGEHGLSFLIKTREHKILFDAGQSRALLDNARALGEDLKDVDFIILSHSHYDHTGGLEKVLEINKNARIIMKRSILEEKYSNSSGSMKEIGFKLRGRYREYPNEFILLDGDYNLRDGIRVVGDIGKYSDFEGTQEGLFVKEEDKYVRDRFSDELFLIVEKDDKLNIITGCSHRGIINILRSAMDKTGIERINLLLGGMHLSGMKIQDKDLREENDDRLLRTIQEMKKIDIERIYTNHCTGIDGFMRLKTAMEEKVYYSYTGSRIRV
ncbi:MBL fold hydrolase [Propionigenium maris DSM 9537]|uniref:MBL fold hydrolase n=1 Tax=Propionigenium maris DSM 9537 TaxID=1123000 RepID=A0A9W6LM31_9FUSO|nr:MBL fold metallo-hydrolase [Propionigenium maris]GLI55354.1 MBL fold hydrolase [Propionigenium maris DSM 9537]